MITALKAHDALASDLALAPPIGSEQALRAQSNDARAFAAVINIDAGGLSGAKRRRIVHLLRTRAGLPPERIRYADGASLARTLREAAAMQPAAVIVCGGDGTARTAVETLTPLGTPTALVPGGTLNRLAATVSGHRSAERIIANLRQGRPDWIPAGAVNGRRFYVVSGYGPPMRLNAVREEIRASRWGEAWAAWRRATKDMFGPSLTIGPSGREASCAIVALGPIDSAFGLRPPQDRGAFEVGSALWRGWPGALALAPFAFLGGWRRRPGVDAAQDRVVTLQGPREGMPALLDGEPFLLPSEVQITYEERAGLVWR